VTPPAGPDPLERADVKARVDKALSGFLAGRATRLDAVGEELGPVADGLTEFLLAGGKRLRPAFCFWAARGAGMPDSDELVAASACLEMLQACALIHDDVMDSSDTRRGQPAVHRRFAALHRANGWRGDPESFGLSAAVLLGDLCLIWGDQMLDESGLDPAALNRARPVHDDLRGELMAGQYLDLLEQAVGGGSVASALRVARFKSAKYTIERPLHLGAALAGAPDATLAAYRAYGLPLGEAFQLRDDVLGVFGDPARTGKPAGDDLREGKRTVLVAAALERASSAQAAVVRRHLGDPHLDSDGVAALRAVLADTGALAEVERLVAARTSAALAALEGAPVEPEARGVLRELAVAATSRAV